jgi:hydroxysqualene synthase
VGPPRLDNDECNPNDRIFLALGATIRARNLPVKLFEDLLSAFRQDITTHRYSTWDAILSYCQRSANPVGRLVLRIAGYNDPRLDRSSDALCTALQLTNFWQDVDRDWQNGRLYVPLEDVDACHALVRDLSDRRMTEPWQCALKRVVARTRQSFHAGREVCDGVRGRLRYELRLTWLGGMRILDRVERVDFNVFMSRPTLGVADTPSLLWRALAWRREISRSSIGNRRSATRATDAGRSTLDDGRSLGPRD